MVFCADAAFAKEEICVALEERGVKYAIHMPANDSLEWDIAELLRRPVGRFVLLYTPSSPGRRNGESRVCPTPDEFVRCALARS